MQLGRGILGGTFNPPHIGHLRLALEINEVFAPLISGVDLLPCAYPPHKPTGGLLPFDLRCQMVEAGLQTLSQNTQQHLFCNKLESTLPAPSYTWKSLEALVAQNPQRPLYFILGSNDFALLPTWYRGLDLPDLCHLIVAPRGLFNTDDFIRTTLQFWPHAGQITSDLQGTVCLTNNSGSKIYFVPLTWLDLSASDIRKRWLADLSVDFLVPAQTLAVMCKHKQTLLDIWNRTTDATSDSPRNKR